MKAVLLTGFLFITAVVSSQNQRFVNFYTGANFPNGNYGKVESNKAGAAMTGMVLEVEAGEIYENRLGFSVKGGYATNRVDYEGLEESGDLSPIDLKGENHRYSFILPGGMYRMRNEKVFVDWKLHAGVVFSRLPEITRVLLIPGNYRTTDFDGDDDISFGYNPSISAGVIFDGVKVFIQGELMEFKAEYFTNTNQVFSHPIEVHQKYSNIEMLVGVSWSFF